MNNLHSQELNQDELLLIEYDSGLFNLLNQDQLSNDLLELDDAGFGQINSIKKVKNIKGQKMELAKFQNELEQSVKMLDVLNRNATGLDANSDEYYQAMDSITDFIFENIASKAQSKLTELEKVLEYTWNQRKPVEAVS